MVHLHHLYNLPDKIIDLFWFRKAYLAKYTIYRQMCTVFTIYLRNPSLYKPCVLCYTAIDKPCVLCYISIDKPCVLCYISIDKQCVQSL